MKKKNPYSSEMYICMYISDEYGEIPKTPVIDIKLNTNTANG